MTHVSKRAGSCCRQPCSSDDDSPVSAIGCSLSCYRLRSRAYGQGPRRIHHPTHTRKGVI